LGQQAIAEVFAAALQPEAADALIATPIKLTDRQENCFCFA